MFLQYIHHVIILASLQDTHWGKKWLYSLNIDQFLFKLPTTHTDRHLTVSQTLLYELQKFQGGGGGGGNICTYIHIVILCFWETKCGL